MLSVLLCCAAIFAVSIAAPGGAPASTCDGLTPLPGSPHVANGIMEQPTPNPWTIDICDFDEIMGFYTYAPGQTYNSKWCNSLSSLKFFALVGFQACIPTLTFSLVPRLCVTIAIVLFQIFQCCVTLSQKS